MFGSFSKEALETFQAMQGLASDHDFSEGVFDFKICEKPNGQTYGVGDRENCAKPNKEVSVNQDPGVRQLCTRLLAGSAFARAGMVDSHRLGDIGEAQKQAGRAAYLDSQIAKYKCGSFASGSPSRRVVRSKVKAINPINDPMPTLKFAEAVFDFKTCQKPDGDVYGIPDDANCGAPSKEIIQKDVKKEGEKVLKNLLEVGESKEPEAQKWVKESYNNHVRKYEQFYVDNGFVQSAYDRALAGFISNAFRGNSKVRINEKEYHEFMEVTKTGTMDEVKDKLTKTLGIDSQKMDPIEEMKKVFAKYRK
jgi:hypothetical protein